ncbi:hypothetical protein [Phreatobacter stygius]|uniref:Uncharacterized protein n=1 Tax=Phreatobacter stygius TaxID=1940610 RepID=A0A4D7B5Q0_9HYPH|nr:hypothetical protein [Phreatobacter stygius]QCI63337.1 hypothetical protein E8M01_03250 [Phreatobacter stygius]
MTAVTPPTAPALPSAVPAMALTLVLVAVVAQGMTGLTLWLAPAGLALALYAIWEWPGIRAAPRLLLGIGIIVVAAAMVSRGNAQPAVEAVGRAAFFAAFPVAMALLREAAVTSPLMLRSSRYLVNQPPGRRYWALTWGGHLIGLLLSFGALTLLTTMIKQSNTTTDARVHDIRERRMVTAVMRGFITMPLWSPTSIALIAILQSNPALHWIDVAPVGLALASGFIMLGWIVDRLQFRPRTALPVEADPGPWTAVGGLGLLILVLTALCVTTAWLTGTSLQLATMLVIPVYTVAWASVQWRDRGLHGLDAMAGAVRHIAGAARRSFPAARNETVLFAASGLISAAAPDLIPAGAAPWLIGQFAGHSGLFLVVLLWLVVGLALIGLTPMVTVALFASALGQAVLPGVDPVRVAVALAGGWALSVGVAPLSNSVLMIAPLIDRSPMEVGPRWNGVYSVIALGLLSLGLAVS